MKLSIYTDELCPYYGFTRENYPYKDVTVEVSEQTFLRWQAIQELWDELQDELAGYIPKKHSIGEHEEESE